MFSGNQGATILNQVCMGLAAGFRDRLRALNCRVVLAESCTAGRVAATLGCLPGISNWLCGCFVVYRCDSKTKWLGIPPEILDDPHMGPVSAATSGRLAEAAVRATPEARFGLAVTGDVGPGAPTATDGMLFVAMFDSQTGKLFERSVRLLSPAPPDESAILERTQRLDEATAAVLAAANDWLAKNH